MRSLSIHAQYGCRRSGACCTADWPIPIEADRLARAQLAIASAQLRPTHPDVPVWIAAGDGPTDTVALVGTRHHACIFYDAERERSCRMHTALGHSSLPLACRQFPRISVIDPRGVSVTLSHYCPTAARLLDRGSAPALPVWIDDEPAAFPADGEYVGLDVQSALPPLLRPGLLMDWDAWWEWERLAVACLTASGLSPAETLGRLHAAVEHVRTWSPGDGLLIDAVRGAFADRPSNSSPRSSGAPIDTAHSVRDILNAVPSDLRPAPWAVSPPPSDEVIGRFLAAHAFASWTAHLGQGLRAWRHSIEGAMALLTTGMDVRQVDLVLRHLADTDALISAWNQAEINGRHAYGLTRRLPARL